MLDFEEYIQKCIVKVFTPMGLLKKKKFMGTGFWVLENHILTCQHCIKDSNRKIQHKVLIEYHSQLLEAQYCDDLSNPDGDIAVLKITTEAKHYVVPLGKTLFDTEVRVLGFREGFPEAYRMTGLLRPGQRLPSVGEIYNLTTSQPEKSSVVGMSGSPVFVPPRAVIVGMLYGEESAGPQVCYVHPIEKTFKFWETLETQNTVISRHFDPVRLRNYIQETNREDELKIIEPQSVIEAPELKRLFHKIVPIRWKYIAAAADSARSLYQELWPQLTNQSQGVRLVCILGEPLSGKSTLMRRLGFDLALSGKLVLHVVDLNKGIWPVLFEAARLICETIYVLIDDILSDEKIFVSLRNLYTETDLGKISIVILATSIIDNTTQRALRDLAKIEFPTFSKNLILTTKDKEKILQNIEIDPLSIEARSFERLMDVNSFFRFLAQIREIIEQTEFQPIETIPAETLEARRLNRLRALQPNIYDCYKYVCFCHRLQINTPHSLVLNLENGRFAGAFDSEVRKQLIFETEDDKNPSLEAAHWALAKIHWDVYSQFENSSDVIEKLVRASQPSVWREAIFITHLFRTCIEEENIDIKSLLIGLAPIIEGLQKTTGVDHLVIWEKIYLKLGMTEDVERCTNEAKNRAPVNVADLRVLIDMIEDDNPERALKLLEEWRTQNPDNGALDVKYLLFLKKKYSPKLQEEIVNTSEWLRDIGERFDVFGVYVDLLIQYVPNLIPTVRESTLQWLRENAEHRNTGSIWIGYLKLIKAQAEQYRKLIERHVSNVSEASHFATKLRNMILSSLDECGDWLFQHTQARGSELHTRWDFRTLNIESNVSTGDAPNYSKKWPPHRRRSR
jgi:hypothetical protein